MRTGLSLFRQRVIRSKYCYGFEGINRYPNISVTFSRPVTMENRDKDETDHRDYHGRPLRYRTGGD